MTNDERADDKALTTTSDSATPPHLVPLDRVLVGSLVEAAEQVLAFGPTVRLEVNAFAESGTPHDAKRVAEALHMVAERMAALAGEFEQAR